MVIALDVLVEIGTAPVKKRVVIGRQGKIDNLRFALRNNRKVRDDEREQRRNEQTHRRLSFLLADQTPVFFHRFDVGGA